MKRRRRRRRNPRAEHPLEWLSLRTALGAGVALGLTGLLEARRARCDDGLPGSLGCSDLTSAAILVALPVAVGLGGQGGRLEPGTFRTGVAVAGAIWGALWGADVLTGARRVDALLEPLRDEPPLPSDLRFTSGTATIPHDGATTFA